MEELWGTWCTLKANRTPWSMSSSSSGPPCVASSSEETLLRYFLANFTDWILICSIEIPNLSTECHFCPEKQVVTVTCHSCSAYKAFYPVNLQTSSCELPSCRRGSLPSLRAESQWRQCTCSRYAKDIFQKVYE